MSERATPQTWPLWRLMAGLHRILLRLAGEMPGDWVRYRREGLSGGERDYNLFYIDLDASAEAQNEYFARARAISGLDPETGEWLDE
jgi:hypothetical protein